MTPITHEALYAEWQKHLESAAPSGSGLTTMEIAAALSGDLAVSRERVDKFLRAMVSAGRVRVTRKRVATRVAGRMTTVPSYIFLPEPPAKEKKKRGEA